MSIKHGAPRAPRHRPGRTPSRAALSVGAAALFVLLCGPAAAASTIYRTVDEDGNVVFTDVPPRPDQSGDAVELTAPNSFEPPQRAEGQMRLEDWMAQGAGDAQDGTETAAPSGYLSLSIASPADNEAIRDNAGNVAVTAALEPELAPGHAVQLYLDGRLQQSARTTTFQLTNVDRGTHNVELRVVDQSGQVLIASEPAVFHLQRRSVILQPPPPRPTGK